MNMPLYFYDAARIFERRAAVDAGKAADVCIFYSLNEDEFYYSSCRSSRAETLADEAEEIRQEF